MQYWYTLAVSDLGTVKMKFRDQMGKREAIKMGKEYCQTKNIEYKGIYDWENIDHAEIELREKIYQQ